MPAIELTCLLNGAALGAAAGLSPGPLQALVLSESLRHGRREGVKASIAPLLTDIPIVIVSLGLLSRVAALDTVMGIVSILGAVFLARLAWGNLKPGEDGGRPAAAAPASLKRAVIANFLSPHPYMFWMLVGAPTVLAAAREKTLAAVFFVLGFYLVLVGTFALLALGAGSSRRWMRGKAYRRVMGGLGGVLLLFAALLLIQGLRRLWAG